MHTFKKIIKVKNDSSASEKTNDSQRNTHHAQVACITHSRVEIKAALVSKKPHRDQEDRKMLWKPSKIFS